MSDIKNCKTCKHGVNYGDRIDKFMLDHNSALRAGIVQADVWIVKEEI